MKSIINARRSVLGAILLGSALALSAAPSSKSLNVNYGDLDMASPKGAQALYTRISRAAQRVCNKPASVRDLAVMMVYDKCYKGSVANAVAHVNERTLTALHRAKTEKARAS